MFEAYHGVTGAQHQTNFNRLTAHGYRMISLSVYGDPGEARYAAVWVQRQGAAWVAVHGVDGAGYQSFFNTWTAKGYVPVLVSATGPSIMQYLQRSSSRGSRAHGLRATA